MDLQELRRFPDVDGPGLTAHDAADRLILDESAGLLRGADVVVIDDSYGALTLGAFDAGAGRVRTHQDVITGERALAANAERAGIADLTQLPFNAAAVRGARVVLLRLPRSLDRLAEVAALVAAHADPGVVLVAGGRIKHMSMAMNDVLGEVFDRVDVSHARQKSRVLFARGPRPEVAAQNLASWPQLATHTDPSIDVAAHGGVFAGNRIDIGTRLLLRAIDDAVPGAQTAVDLACGSGIIASSLALARPTITVLATDRSAAAVRSALATAAANGVGDRVRVTQADGLENVTAGTAELVLLNPPFHSDAALSTGIAQQLFADAARALRPGGELWCVWNSHLRYRADLERTVGSTRQVCRNAKFTVTASIRRDSVEGWTSPN